MRKVANRSKRHTYWLRKFLLWEHIEAATGGVLYKKSFHWNFAKLTGRHLCQGLFFNTVACNFIKKEYLTQLFSCEFCEISKNTFFTEHLRTTASKQNLKLFGPFLWIGFNCLKATEPPRVLTSLLWTCFDPLSHQKFLALNWSTSERWKVGSTLEPPRFFFPYRSQLLC